MKKILTTLFLLGILILVGFYSFNQYLYNKKPEYSSQNSENFSDTVFVIDKKAMKIGGELKYFGNELRTDLNGDSKEDVVFLVTQNGGGSGTFFYAVAAVRTETGYEGTDGYLLGDRIAPQTTEISQNPNHKNVVVINYADRVQGESITTAPSVGVSVYLKLGQDNRWAIVESDYPGAADPDKMTLAMKTWVWQSTDYGDGRIVSSDQPEVFTLTFANDGTVEIGTDCNQVRGEYQANNGQMTFSNLLMTRMYCEGSQEAEFVSFLEDTATYQFTTRGELRLQQNEERATMTFR